MFDIQDLGGYSGPTGPDSLPSDVIAPFVFDNSPGATIGEPIVQSTSITPSSSAPATDPYSIGGIFGGISNVVTAVSRVVAANKIGTGMVPNSYLRAPGSAVGLGPASSLGSLPILVLLGAAAYLFFKKKAGA